MNARRKYGSRDPLSAAGSTREKDESAESRAGERPGRWLGAITAGWALVSYTRARRVRRAQKASPQRAAPVSAQVDGSGAATTPPLKVKLVF